MWGDIEHTTSSIQLFIKLPEPRENETRGDETWIVRFFVFKSQKARLFARSTNKNRHLKHRNGRKITNYTNKITKNTTNY